MLREKIVHILELISGLFFKLAKATAQYEWYFSEGHRLIASTNFQRGIIFKNLIFVLYVVEVPKFYVKKNVAFRLLFQDADILILALYPSKKEQKGQCLEQC